MSPPSDRDRIPDAGSMWTEHRLELLIGRLLQSGVILASAVVLIGGILLVARHGSSVPDFRVFHGTEDGMRHLSQIGVGAASGDPAAIVLAGIVLLILTPIVRVAFMLVAFALQRDRLYVILTAIVLGVLLYGFFAAN